MKYTKLILLVFFFPVILLAQGGSIYTRYGLGDVFYSHSARKAAMGDLGIGVFDRDNLSYLNPASWSKIKYTKFQASVDFNGINAADEQTKAFYSNGIFTGFLVGIPVERDLGITAAAGVVPVTNVRYEINGSLVDGEVPYTRSFKGTGGLSKIFLGSTYTLPFDFSIGASLEYYMGTINHYSNITFQSSTYENTSYRRTYQASGLGASMGFISNDFSKLLKVKLLTGLRLGMSYTIPSKLHADSSLLETTGSVEDFVLASTKSTANFPSSLGIGMSLEINKDYTFVVDYFTQPWSNYKFNDNTLSNMRDAQKISGGFEYKKAEPSSSSFWEMVALRAGVSYEKTQYMVNGEGINQFTVNGGFTIPLDFINALDIGLQYGIRGTKDFNLVKENIFKINIGVSLGEPWFIR